MTTKEKHLAERTKATVLEVESPDPIPSIERDLPEPKDRQG